MRGRLRAVLREQPMLATRSAAEIERVVEVMTEQRLEAGQQVVQQGVAGDTFYAVLSGIFWLGVGVGLG